MSLKYKHSSKTLAEWTALNPVIVKDEIIIVSDLNKTKRGDDETEFINLPYLSSDIISVKDFGAKGDGVTDDTAAFKAALLWTETFLNSNTFFIPVGHYIINDKLEVRCGTDMSSMPRILGGGMKSCILDFTGNTDTCCFEWGTTFNQSYFGSLKDVKIKGNKNIDGIIMQTTENVTSYYNSFENINIENIKNGINQVPNLIGTSNSFTNILVDKYYAKAFITAGAYSTYTNLNAIAPSNYEAGKGALNLGYDIWTRSCSYSQISCEDQISISGAVNSFNNLTIELINKSTVVQTTAIFVAGAGNIFSKIDFQYISKSLVNSYIDVHAAKTTFIDVYADSPTIDYIPLYAVTFQESSNGVMINCKLISTYKFGDIYTPKWTFLNTISGNNYLLNQVPNSVIKMTSTQRDALTPIEGDEIYNTSTHAKQYYNGTAWV